MMTEREQAQEFEREVNKVIDHFRNEYDLSFAAAVGVLKIIKHQLMEEMWVEEEGDD